ncbi:winged helix-turn-helix transcriptional regulator [Streptococcus suis]|uniref:winged helix-turn-helix transcriptional regulator n=1 Tax=Streptococcus suis TaxID=1307 RepID=UPI001559AF14|nr:helix-turn-helix domain-containing protein [Streptococcus suis]
MPDYHTKNIYACPYLVTQTVLSGKWNILLLHHIEEGAIRFNELHRKLEGISQATLTKQLRQLEEDGLITRKVYAQVPPKVEYELSEMGQEFKAVLEQIEIFGDKYIDFAEKRKK